MPKRFIFALVIVQAILTFLHWLMYLEVLALFPTLAAYKTSLAIIILAFSFGFLCLSAVSHFRENFVIRVLYVIFGAWNIFVLYFLLGGLLAVILKLPLFLSLPFFGIGVLSIAIVLTVYGLVNARISRVTSILVKLPNLPPAWNGKTAVLVSDLHLGHILKTGFARKVVKLINSQTPDIVFVAGDFYDGVQTNFQELADEFKNIKAPLGTYYSSGNHEIYAGYQKCEQALTAAGIKILEDAKVELSGLQILGLAYKSETDETVAERLAKLNIDPAKPSVLLKHIPDHLKAVEKAGVNFQLSGHTHLAQVWPFMFITHKVFKGYDYGLNKIGNLQIFTSCGVGTWGPPLRVGTKSEIVKITFQPLNGR
ncbi:MAG: metallophosphoesterase [Candidatus Doudnabacteria bacterium]|nr:metallophosphoesterase [Candidatus Doudnabacteria bacterium]